MSRYPNLNNHSFSVCHLWSKNGVPWRRMANSARSSVTQVLFLPDNCHTLACNRSALWVLPMLPHETLKRCVLKGRYLIKLIIFTASSRAFVGEVDFFFFKPWMSGSGEYSDYWYSQMPLPWFLLRHPPLPWHHQCKPRHIWRWLWPCSTPREDLGPYFENHRIRPNCLIHLHTLDSPASRLPGTLIVTTTHPCVWVCIYVHIYTCMYLCIYAYIFMLQHLLFQLILVVLITGPLPKD